MSALPNARPITIEEFENYPEFDGIQELLDAVVVEMPPPKLRHSEIVQAIEAILLRRLARKRVWVKAGFLIRRNCPQPDVAVTHLDQGTERGWFRGAPLLAIEVASKGNTPDELEFKKNLYLANGAEGVWIVYDKTRSIVVHRGIQSVSHRTDFMSEALGIEIPFAEVFAKD